jgi:hypothetical protein
MILMRTASILFKHDKDLMSAACPSNLFGKIWIAQKQGLHIVNTLC